MLDDVRFGLIVAGLCLLFGILMGVMLGLFEDGIKEMISAAVDSNLSAHAEPLSTAKSKIFRWWQRAHFHATGIGAFTIALVGITAMSNLRPGVKRLTALLIALGGIYPFSWLLMALKAPILGRPAAHHYFPAEVMVMIAVVCLLTGMGILFLNIAFKFFNAPLDS